jgi:hypothetical protein
MSRAALHKREGHNLGRAAQPKKDCGFQPLRFAAALTGLLRVLDKDEVNLRVAGWPSL